MGELLYGDLDQPGDVELGGVQLLLRGEVKGLVSEVYRGVYSDFDDVVVKCGIGFDVVVDSDEELQIILEKEYAFVKCSSLLYCALQSL